MKGIDQTDFHRAEPSSHAFYSGEQPHEKCLSVFELKQANIEVPKEVLHEICIKILACYPKSNYYRWIYWRVH